MKMKVNWGRLLFGLGLFSFLLGLIIFGVGAAIVGKKPIPYPFVLQVIFPVILGIFLMAVSSMMNTKIRPPCEHKPLMKMMDANDELPNLDTNNKSPSNWDGASSTVALGAFTLQSAYYCPDCGGYIRYDELLRIAKNIRKKGSKEVK